MVGPAWPAVIGLATSAAGLLAGAAGIVLADTGSSGVGPWAQVTGTAAAVGGLVYVAKLLADGRLVAVQVADLLDKSAHREEQMKGLVEAGAEREAALRAFLIQKGTMG